MFFVFFTFTIEPGEIVDALPVAIGLAVLTGVTKATTGAWAARHIGVAVRGQVRAGTVLIARGEFSIVIAGLATASAVQEGLAALATSYVLVLAIAGPILTRFADPIAGRRPGPQRPPRRRAAERAEQEAAAAAAAEAAARAAEREQTEDPTP